MGPQGEVSPEPNPDNEFDPNTISGDSSNENQEPVNNEDLTNENQESIDEQQDPQVG